MDIKILSPDQPAILHNPAPRLPALRLIVPAVVMVLLLLSGCNNEAQQAPGGFPPPAVSVAEVVQREITPWAEFSGRIEAKEVVQVRPRVGGIIQQIKYREGDIVKKGDLLFVIDQQPFRAELNRDQAELERARAHAELSRVELERSTDLLKRNLISQDEYDQRVAGKNQADANVRAAEATVKLAKLNLEYTEVRSPIDGRTGRAVATKGNLVSSTPTPDILMTIISLDPVYVVFDSDELTYLQFFSDSYKTIENDTTEKRMVYVGLGNSDDFPHQGYVDFVDNQVNPDTGTIQLRAVLDNKNFQLTPGLFARVKLLATAPQTPVMIADQAVLTDQDRKYVYVLGDENQAIRRDIIIGRSIEGLRIVNKGLSAGEKIIVHGIQKVFFPNMPVAPQTIGMSDPPPTPGSPPAQQN